MTIDRQLSDPAAADATAQRRFAVLPTPAPGRTALVTGALSGIGPALAHALANTGHHLTLVADDEEGLRELAAELSQTRDAPIETIVCDVADARDRARLPGVLRDRGLEVAILVNNPATCDPAPGDGTSRTVVRLADQVARDELAAMQARVNAVVELSGVFLPAMLRRASGRIFNVVASPLTERSPGAAIDGACRAFVLSYTDTLARELLGSGVHATTLLRQLCVAWGMDRAAEWADTQPPAGGSVHIPSLRSCASSTSAGVPLSGSPTDAGLVSEITTRVDPSGVAFA